MIQIKIEQLQTSASGTEVNLFDGYLRIEEVSSDLLESREEQPLDDIVKQRKQHPLPFDSSYIEENAG